jgi:cysteinyl-tRNA synthetase
VCTGGSPCGTAALGCLPPTLEPRATEHIADIIDLTQRLLDKGFAYAVDGTACLVYLTASQGAISSRNEGPKCVG